MLFRFAIAALCLLGWAIVKGDRFPSSKNRLKLIALGSIGFVVQSFCFFSSLLLIPGSLAAILLYLYPSFVVVLLSRLGRSISLAQSIALALSFMGSYLVIHPAIEQSGIRAIGGSALAIGAAIANALYVVVGEAVLLEEESIPAVGIMSASAAAVYSLIGCIFGFSLPSSILSWGAVLWIGVVCAALAIGLLFEGIKHIGSANAAILSTLEPIIALAIGVSFLGEVATIEKLIGAALIAGAAMLVAK